MNKRHELPIPPQAMSATSSTEVARIWATEDAQHFTVATSLWEDPAAWGLILVDLARHVANAYEQANGTPAKDVLNRLKEAFDAEWDSPTDEPVGEISE